MKRFTKALLISTLLLLAITPITQVRAANEWVGVSATLPQISYYTYNVESKNGSTITKNSITMSIRNITTQSTKSLIYCLFETDMDNFYGPAFIQIFEIKHEKPEEIDTSSVIGILITAALILSMTDGWIINKALVNKSISYNFDLIFDLSGEIVWDSNGVLKNFRSTDDTSGDYVSIKRVIEPLYIYGAGLLIGVIFVVVVAMCIKRK